MNDIPIFLGHYLLFWHIDSLKLKLKNLKYKREKLLADYIFLKQKREPVIKRTEKRGRHQYKTDHQKGIVHQLPAAKPIDLLDLDAHLLQKFDDKVNDIHNKYFYPS
jgi:gluconate kinase